MDKLEVVEIADAGSLDGDEGDGITRSHGSTRRGFVLAKTTQIGAARVVK
jgi:hypothetical protein